MKYFTKYLPDPKGDYKTVQVGQRDPRSMCHCKAGDVFIYESTTDGSDDPIHDIYRNPINGMEMSSTILFETGWAKPVKLFLCSRDIQVGDIAFSLPAIELNKPKLYYRKIVKEDDFSGMDTAPFKREEVEKYYWEDGCWNYKCDVVKVIGEVSPEATWVKEGMEFDEYNCVSKKGDVKFIGISIKNGSLVRTLITERQYLKAQSEYTLGSHPFLKIEIKDPCGHFH